MFTRIRALSAWVLPLLMAMAVPAAASDAVMEWNQIALAATVTAGQGAVPQTRSMAIVHVAMHDAVNAITGQYRTYLSHAAPPAGADPEAAAIAAAHSALIRLFPSQASTTLNAARAASLAARGLSESDPGVAFGDGVGAGLFAHRASDGATQATYPYVAPGAGLPGVWVAVGTAPIVLPGWGKVTPWVLDSGDQFRPDTPPSLDSGRYARDYNEVRELGSLNSTVRTADQTQIAIFWTGSPSAIWNGVARQVILARNLDLSSTARALALLYLSASDSGIACWDAKYTYNLWRPITAIRNADADGNDATIAEPDWSPLFATHQHPEYPSGHSTNSGAMASTLMLLFGDDPGVAIAATSPTNPGFVRHWSTFSEGVQEVIDARIYSGFHYRTSDDVGAKLGRQVARFVVNHALRATNPNEP
ncbi:MAG: vanadium-dependent haloperoxidase [Vicinamibacterales bacterium]